MAAISARRRPDICSLSEASVQAALEQLRYMSLPPVPGALDDLTLIDEVLLASEVRLTAARRRYAVAEVLIDIIRGELGRHREAMGLILRETEISRSDALAAIAADATTASTQLLGWSWLYYGYVTVELDISVNLFCQTASIHPRTLTRYRHQTVSRLTQKLIQREEAARKRNRRRHLARQFSRSAPAVLVGRDCALAQLDLCPNLWIPQQVQVIGVAGIGKTALVEHAVQRLIEQEAVDQFIWVTSPTSVQAIRARLSTLQDETAGLSLREYLECSRTLIVIDDAEDLNNDLGQLEELLDELARAFVFLTAQTPLPIRSTSRFIVLSALSESEAKSLIRTHANKWFMQGSDPLSVEEITQLWEVAGGNPRLIEQTVLDWQLLQLQQPQHSSPSKPEAPRISFPTGIVGKSAAATFGGSLQEGRRFS